MFSAGGIHLTSFQSNKEFDVYIHNVFVRQTLPVFPSAVGKLVFPCFTGAATLVVDNGCICMAGFIHDAPLCAELADFVGDVAGLIVVTAVARVLLLCWYDAFAQCSFFTQVSAVRAVDHRFLIKSARVSTFVWTVD